MKAVIYARYSSDNQREESIEVNFGSVANMLSGIISSFLVNTSTVL